MSPIYCNQSGSRAKSQVDIVCCQCYHLLSILFVRVDLTHILVNTINNNGAEGADLQHSQNFLLSSDFGLQVSILN